MSAPGGQRFDTTDQRRKLVLVIALTGTVMLVEAFGGILSRSLALISDAGHMLTDLLALVLCLMAVHFASRPATPAKTYGYHRVEILTALVNGTILMVVAVVIGYHAVRRYLHPQALESRLMIAVALIGLLANLVGLAILSHRHRSLNIRSARMHLLGDALSSGGVLVAALLIAATGWRRLDSIVAGGIAVVIAIGAGRLTREAVDVLLEATPAGIGLEDVSRAIRAVPGVVEVHDLHVWSITTGLPALSGHVRVAGGNMTDGDEMLNRIKEIIHQRFGIVHTTIQVESSSYQELGDIH